MTDFTIPFGLIGLFLTGYIIGLIAGFFLGRATKD